MGTRSTTRCWTLRCVIAGGLMLTVLPGAGVAVGAETDRAGVIRRVSVGSEGHQAVARVPAYFGSPSISTDGRYMAFTSDASDLVERDTNNEEDVFVRDRQSGTTSRVSVGSDGTEGDLASSEPEISRDGRYVAFSSEASTLVAGDDNGFSDVFVHDRSTSKTVRVSIGADDVQGDRPSWEPSLDASANLITFSSEASTLVAGDDNGFHDVFVRDLATGTTTLVSPTAEGRPGNDGSFSPVLSANGKVVAFSSVASDLVDGDTNNSTDVFVRLLAENRTERVSVGGGGEQANDGSAYPAIDDTGTVVVFFSGATNLTAAPDTNNTPDLFVRERGPSASTERVSVADDGREADGTSYSAVMSGDGSQVVFASDAANLVDGDTNDASDVFLRSRGPSPSTHRMSVDPTGAQLDEGSDEAVMTPDARFVAFTNFRFDPDGDGDAAPTATVLLRDTTAAPTVVVDFTEDGQQAGSPPSSGEAVVSGNGRVVAFSSSASDLVRGDSNRAGDVFLHDLRSGKTTRLSLGLEGEEADADSWSPRLSSNGRFVAYASDATNLVTGDTNDSTDVFILDRLKGSTVRVSTDSDGAEADSGSYSPVISTDGRVVAFSSEATNLVGGDTNGVGDVFVHDLDSGTTTRVSVGAGGVEADLASVSPSISGDGRLVAFNTEATNLVAGDTNSRNDVFVHDRRAATTARVGRGLDGAEPNQDIDYPAISADGRYVAFSAVADNLVRGDTNKQGDVFLVDLATQTTERISLGLAGQEPDDSSFDPWVGADGRYVAFGSAATNLVPGDTNGKDDIFIRDRIRHSTVRASRRLSGEPDSDSYLPSMSDAGRLLTFSSSATNLVARDTNAADDVFLYYATAARVPPSSGWLKKALVIQTALFVVGGGLLFIRRRGQGTPSS